MYSNMDRIQLQNAIVRNMILKNKRFEDVQRHILEDFYNRLINGKRRVIGEDKKIRENMVKKLCEVNNDEELQDILNKIEPC